MIRKHITRVLIGLTLIAAAVVLFGNLMGWWDMTDFAGWWTLFLIIPGIVRLAAYGFDFISAGMILLGAWLLARERGWVSREFSGGLIWVVILFLVGLELIFGLFRKKRISGGPVVLDGVKGEDGSNSVHYSAVFGSVEVVNNSRTFCGGTVTAIFGGAEIDLREAVPVDGAALETNAVFGGVTIRAPRGCRIQIQGIPILGGCECLADRPDDPSLPLLVIRYSAVCGGVEIK